LNFNVYSSIVEYIQIYIKEEYIKKETQKKESNLRENEIIRVMVSFRFLLLIYFFLGLILTNLVFYEF
jgi:hypothetical protein